VRLNDKEHTIFTKAVKRSGIQQQAYLRHLLTGYMPKERPPSIYYEMMEELRKTTDGIRIIKDSISPSRPDIVKAYNDILELYTETLRDITKEVIEPEKMRK